MGEISREELKHNFLKNVMIRFDYNGITESELDDLVKEIKPILKEKGYCRMIPKVITEMDIQINDPEEVEMQGLKNDIKYRKIFVFYNEREGVTFRVSSYFAYILIEEKAHYIDFKDYAFILLKAILTIKQKFQFFEGTRFGLRKINKLILKEPNLLNNYFSEEYYRVLNLTSKAELAMLDSRSFYEEDNKRINIIRNVLKGVYNNESAYQVVLDLDIYIKSLDDINNVINNQDIILDMNNRLFEVYKHALTPAFMEKLAKEVFDDNCIVGVESNG